MQKLSMEKAAPIGVELWEMHQKNVKEQERVRVLLGQRTELGMEEKRLEELDQLRQYINLVSERTRKRR